MWLCFQMSMQTLSLCVFHNQVNVLGWVNCFIQLDHVWKVETTQNSNLSNRLLLTLKLLELWSVILFYCNFFAAWLVDALLYNSISTVTDLLSEVVHVNVAAGWRRELIRIVHQGALWVNLTEGIAFESTAISSHLTWTMTWINFSILHPTIEECVTLILLLLLTIQ